ncbi:MAG TPA: hypothetical protein VFB39_15525 [Solirubrobacteraceae bacterium]|nr:hypothetical protein [Solirubrobacteraceae bacterium]
MGKPSRVLLALAFVFTMAVGVSSAKPSSLLSTSQGPPARPSMQPTAAPARPLMQPPGFSALAAPNTGNQLYADSCSSTYDCWAVGFYANKAGARLGRAIHFHHGTWSGGSVPEPSSRNAAGYDYLDAVHCNSPTSCWAVGYYGNKAKASRNEVLHWTGKRWQNVGIKQPAGFANGADQNQLNGVTCASGRDCWAVGDYTNRAGAYVNAAFHWDGTKWTLVPTPNSHGTANGEENVLDSVVCNSKSDCLAVGYGRTSSGQYVPEALHWTGTAWATAPTPRPGRTGAHGFSYLEGLTCSSASECWAAGGYNKGLGYDNAIVHWNGTSWTQVTTPDPGRRVGGSELTSVSCASPTSCWAVGFYYTKNAELNEALLWNGKRWRRAATPEPDHAAYAHILRGVACASAVKCWAVGYLYSAPGLSLGQQLLLWNGKKWAVP